MKHLIILALILLVGCKTEPTIIRSTPLTHADRMALMTVDTTYSADSILIMINCTTDDTLNWVNHFGYSGDIGYIDTPWPLDAITLDLVIGCNRCGKIDTLYIR